MAETSHPDDQHRSLEALMGQLEPQEESAAPSAPAECLRHLVLDLLASQPPLPETERLLPTLRQRLLESPGLLGNLDHFLHTEQAIPELEARRLRLLELLEEICAAVEADQEARSELSLLLAHRRDQVSNMVADLTALLDFVVEVVRQRRRLQFLLGCDRALRGLVRSNAEVMDADDLELSRIADELFQVLELIRLELPELLSQESAFSNLQLQLGRAHDRLREIVTDRIEPLFQLAGEVASLRQGLQPLDQALQGVVEACRAVVRMRGSLGGDTSEHLRGLLAGIHDHFRRLSGDLIQQITGSIPDDSGIESEAAQLRQRLEDLDGSGLRDSDRYLQRLEAEQPLDGSGVGRSLSRIRGHFESMIKDALEPALLAMESLRERNTMLFKTRICREIGFIRDSFLQPTFAHIAANDPRSTHSAQYFFVKEFSDEVTQSHRLLRETRELQNALRLLQATPIRGLTFTPENLAKIADRVLLERQTVPSGIGWRELANFLAKVRGDLVPKIHSICALPAVRFDDRRQLMVYSDMLAQHCGELLVQRELAHRLSETLDRLDPSESDPVTFRRCRESMLRVTCEEMAIQLRATSWIFSELVPRVDEMVDGIGLRTSLAFLHPRSARDRI